MHALLLVSLLAGYHTKHLIVEVDMGDASNAKDEGEHNEVELGDPKNGDRKLRVKEDKEGSDYSGPSMFCECGSKYREYAQRRPIKRRKHGGRKQKVKEDKEGLDYSSPYSRYIDHCSHCNEENTKKYKERQNLLKLLRRAKYEPNDKDNINSIFIGKTLEQAKRIIRIRQYEVVSSN